MTQVEQPSADCERWAELSDRRLVGDALSADDETFLAGHARECPFCSAEAHLYDDLESEKDELSQDIAQSLVDHALDARLAPESKKLPLRNRGQEASASNRGQEASASKPRTRSFPSRAIRIMHWFPWMKRADETGQRT